MEIQNLKMIDTNDQYSDVGLIYKESKAFISFDKECGWLAE